MNPADHDDHEIALIPSDQSDRWEKIFLTLIILDPDFAQTWINLAQNCKRAKNDYNQWN